MPSQAVAPILLIFVPAHSDSEEAQKERRRWAGETVGRRSVAAYRRRMKLPEVEILELDGSEGRYNESVAAMAKPRDLVAIEAHGSADGLYGVKNTGDRCDGPLSSLWPELRTEMLVVAACDQRQPYSFADGHGPQVTARFTGTLAEEYARTVLTLSQFMSTADLASLDQFEAALGQMSQPLSDLTPGSAIRAAREHRHNRIWKSVKPERTKDLARGGTGAWVIDRL